MQQTSHMVRQEVAGAGRLPFGVFHAAHETARMWSRWRTWRRFGDFGEMLRFELRARAAERRLAGRLREWSVPEAEIAALAERLKRDASADPVW